MKQRLGITIRAHRWWLSLTILTIVMVGACGEIPVDPDTANVIRRGDGIDTLVLRDTAVIRDTNVLRDTIVTLDRDTLIRMDTVIKVNTVVRVNTVYVRDSVVQRDTIKVGDTLTHYDTVRIRDTVVRRDSITHRDTIEIRKWDTVRDVRWAVPPEGKLYRIKDKRVADVLPVEIEEMSLLNVEIPQGSKEPKSIRLRLAGRVTRPYDTLKWGVPPSWFYMVISKMNLEGDLKRKELFGDPRFPGVSTGALGIFPRHPYTSLWLSTADGEGEGEFVVTKIDGTNRVIHAYIKARFNKFDASIDSLALSMRY